MTGSDVTRIVADVLLTLVVLLGAPYRVGLRWPFVRPLAWPILWVRGKRPPGGFIASLSQPVRQEVRSMKDAVPVFAGKGLPIIGVIGGVTLALGGTFIALKYGQQLDKETLANVIYTSLGLGGGTAIVAVFYGSVIPQVVRPAGK